MLANAAVKVERKASISAYALPPVELLRMGLVLRGHQREILICTGPEARLHDGKRFKQAAKLVTPPDRDVIGKIAGRHAFCNAHRRGDRLAERIGESYCDNDSDECGTEGDPEHGGACFGDRRFRLGPEVEAIGRHQFDEIVECRGGLVALLHQRESRGYLSQAARRRLEDLQPGARPATEASLRLLPRRLDACALDPPAFAPRSMRRVSPTMTAPKPRLAKPSRAKTGYGNGRCEQG